MQTIIRVEHPNDGIGIFASRKKGVEIKARGVQFTPNYDYSPWDIGKMMSRHLNFPTPIEEGMDFKKREDFCAYKTIEQIQQWIMKDEFIKLFEHGFVVYMLDVSECQMGNYQVIYKKKHIMQQKDVSSLFK